MNKVTNKKRIIIITCVIIALVLTGIGKNKKGTESDEKTDLVEVNESTLRTTEATTEAASQGEAENEDDEKQEPTKLINKFVDTFNLDSETKLVFVEDFIPSDKKNGHYRTEFRLNAYKEAVGKSYSYNDTTVDIVSHTVMFGETPMRIYMNGASLQQCEDMIKYTSPIMDNNITEEANNTINYIDENKTANGYYYAELGLVLFNRGDDSYEFMAKPKTD